MVMVLNAVGEFTYTNFAKQLDASLMGGYHAIQMQLLSQICRHNFCFLFCILSSATRFEPCV
jgi:hypothetical protein